MREQTARLDTGRTGRMLRAGFIIVGLLALIGIWCKGIFGEPAFVPPEWEQSAQTGVPKPEKKMNYESITAPTGFSVSLCGTMYQQEDGSLLIYLTNPESNDANIQCRVQDADGTLLYQSGVLRPGEYLERMELLTEIPNEAIPLKIEIYGFEKDTWYSKGTITLDNVLQPY